MATVEKAAPAKKSMKTVIMLLIVALLAGGLGFAAPVVFSAVGGANSHEDKDAKKSDESKQAFVPFDSVTVNLNDSRLSRFLRIKLVIVVQESQEKSVTEAILVNKAILKNWLIGHMCDKTQADIAGEAGFNRARREIQDQFNLLLYPDGSEKIKDIVFEEFNVQ